ncbi:MAG: monooxygenase [Oscillatoriales cyanobacterium RM2_1_1]|nr:monooxygenase [Oscillatoriales cyanobacterium SM2_3_0]NJO48036.1 monooxygenase [Oscillatoriales cyanobacterium RM2_1_1]
MPQIVIVGGGPTGATLALLLVQRGIAVTLIEGAKNFSRSFRGEGLMPSGLDALKQMGLSTLVESIPCRPLDAWEFIFNDQLLFRVEEPMGAQYPCTLVAQPPFLARLMAQAQSYEHLELIQGTPVKDLIWSNQRVAGVKLADHREILAELVIGADGRGSLIRQRAELALVQQPKPIDLLWFKLAAHPKFMTDNVFCSILKGDRGFSIFHGAEPGKLHLAWVLSPEETANWQQVNWSEVFASLAPAWLAEHFHRVAETIEAPIKLSVVVGHCPRWHRPGVLLLGDAAHPMSPVRAQGINLALRDVIVAVNHLVPLFQPEPFLPEARRIEPDSVAIDLALGQIQVERQPEIIQAQRLQAQEAHQGELLRKNRRVRSLLVQLAPLIRPAIRYRWVKRQGQLRQGITSVQLTV